LCVFDRKYVVRQVSGGCDWRGWDCAPHATDGDVGNEKGDTNQTRLKKGNIFSSFQATDDSFDSHRPLTILQFPLRRCPAESSTANGRFWTLLVSIRHAFSLADRGRTFPMSGTTALELERSVRDGDTDARIAQPPSAICSLLSVEIGSKCRLSGWATLR